jgi:hypothetical protein
MKRLVCATLIPSVLALSLIGTGAASAQSYGRGGYDRGYSHSRGHDNTGALIGLGIGLFALGAIVAASSHHDDRDRYDDRAYQTNYAPNGYQNQYQGGYQNGGYQNDYRGNYQNYRGNGYDYRGR